MILHSDITQYCARQHQFSEEDYNRVTQRKGHERHVVLSLHRRTQYRACIFCHIFQQYSSQEQKDDTY